MKACVSFRHSVLQVHNILKSAMIPHSVVMKSSRHGPPARRQFKAPAAVMVYDDFRVLNSWASKGDMPLIIVLSRTEASYTNLPEFDPEHPVPTAKIKLKLSVPSVMDYVNMAVKPSYLMGVQTALYRISNHNTRKIAQAAIIKYLDSKMSWRQLRALLKGNLTTEPLVEIMQSPLAAELQQAVLRVREGQDIRVVEAESSFVSFDILYVIRSSEKNK